MVIDLCALALLMMLTWIGWQRGLLKQVLGWIGVVVAWWASPMCSGWIRPHLLSAGYAAHSVHVASWLLSFAFIIGLTWLVSLWLPKAVHDWSLTAKRADKLCGAGLAGAKGLFVVWLLACCPLLLEKDLAQLHPRFGKAMASSRLMDACRRHNIVAEWAMPELVKIRAALASRRLPTSAPGATSKSPRVAADKDAVAGDAVEPSARLSSHETLRDLGRDASMVEAAKNSDWSRLLGDPRVQRLLSEGPNAGNR